MDKIESLLEQAKVQAGDGRIQASLTSVIECLDEMYKLQARIVGLLEQISSVQSKTVGLVIK